VPTLKVQLLLLRCHGPLAGKGVLPKFSRLLLPAPQNGLPLSLVTKDKIVKFIATKNRNQLTKQARMSYPRGASLLLAKGLSCQQNHASQGGFSSIIVIFHFKPFFGQACYPYNVTCKIFG
jgi:hypothetical protein